MSRKPEDLSVEELERLLAAKRQAARRERIRQFARNGRTLDPDSAFRADPFHSARPASGAAKPSPFDRILLAVEIFAAVGLAFVLLQGARILQDLNREVSAALLPNTPSATALIQAVVLPSGHTPPGSPGGAAPNESEIPAHLRSRVQVSASIALPTRGPEQPIRLDIPAIDKFNLPVVEGDGWEQLKQGVGHHPGSANPGSTGNVVLSAHNDIFGELFRDLDRLQPGDSITLHTATTSYQYNVISIRIVAPTDVEVMNPTNRPTLTLISCYPYMIDNQRIVVTAELAAA